jgi:hypothetical protein
VVSGYARYETDFRESQMRLFRDICTLAERLLRRADRYRLREFDIYESDGAPDEKEGRPKHQQLGYQACMMAQRNVASASGHSFPAWTQAHRAVPSRWALLRVGA